MRIHVPESTIFWLPLSRRALGANNRYSPYRHFEFELKDGELKNREQRRRYQVEPQISVAFLTFIAPAALRGR
ncbi:hypothetical protein [Caballeronia sp. INDeC2]|uniref:hypothetical protein n=1 Tax=Caballeronia sp. INDeC2 TaxID=2921747 RepID=UPI002028FDFA|nr:hypothetical protein [Caballeronia sp. INDeC2]